MTENPQTYSDIWHDCLSYIRTQTTDDEYVRWFKPIVPLDFDGTTLQLRVPDESFVYHIEKNYLQFLKPILQKMFGNKTRLRYVMPKEDYNSVPVSENADSTEINQFIARNDTANIKNPFIIPGIKKVRIDPQLNPNYTFDTFIEGECNKLARSAGLSVAVNPGSTPFNPLYIFGDSGLGKTHIAQAIGMEVCQRHPGLQVLYVSMSKFVNQYTNSVLNKEQNDFIHFYQMIDVLIIDDIQELTGKVQTQNVFFNIFNHLQLAGKQLIITSDKPPVELKDIADRLITRFKWGLSAQLVQPDYDTKLKIIEQKAEQLRTNIPEDVTLFLADNINANVREIEGALSALVANASFMNRQITPSLAEEVLSDYVKVTKREVTIKLIREVVCDYLNVTQEMLDSRRRTRDIAQARQIAMYLSKQHTKAPLTQIGAEIGDRNHATVLHACKTIENLKETDKMFKEQFGEIERRVLARG